MSGGSGIERNSAELLQPKSKLLFTVAYLSYRVFKVFQFKRDKVKITKLYKDYLFLQAKVVLEAQGLEIWPGYTTSLRQHENSPLLCCEISNKIMRLESVLDMASSGLHYFRQCKLENYFLLAIHIFILIYISQLSFR